MTSPGGGTPGICSQWLKGSWPKVTWKEPRWAKSETTRPTCHAPTAGANRKRRTTGAARLALLVREGQADGYDAKWLARRIDSVRTEGIGAEY